LIDFLSDQLMERKEQVLLHRNAHSAGQRKKQEKIYQRPEKRGDNKKTRAERKLISFLTENIE